MGNKHSFLNEQYRNSSTLSDYSIYYFRQLLIHQIQYKMKMKISIQQYKRMLLFSKDVFKG